MEIRPILSAMAHNKIGAFLVSMQIAITLAVMVNAAFIIYERMEKINRPTGMVNEELIFMGLTGFGDSYNHRQSIERDLMTLRNLPGVVSASPIRGIPLSGGGSASEMSPSDDPQHPRFSGNLYYVDETLPETLGIEISSGRWFTQDEIRWLKDADEDTFPDKVVMTEAFARDLFGDEDPIGKIMYNSVGRGATVIGTIKHMQGAWVGWDRLDRVMFYPQVQEPKSTHMAVRTEPGETERLTAEIEEVLGALSRDRVVRWVYPHSYFIEGSYSRDTAMLNLLMVVIGLLVIVTGLGIIGLAAFNVNQRRKQIGTRRALGARQFHILRYFLVENWLVTTMGLTAGVVFTFAISYWLGSHFSLPKIDWRFLPVAIAFIWALGLSAAFGPARRAAMISPATATRSI